MKLRKTNPLCDLLTWFLAFWTAMPANLAFSQQVRIDSPIITGSNTLRLVVSGPTTNIRYDVYFTNILSGATTSWPLLIMGATNQVIFDLTMPATNAGFFIVTSNFVATTNPPPKVATPVFSPPNASGNASVNVTITCDTPGAVIYYTTNGATPTTSDSYIASGGKVLVQCMTTLKARGFRSGFIDSDVATGTYNVNCPPVVFAGHQQVTSGSQVTLQGVATDDGLSMALSNYWRQVSGPATVTWGNRNETNSTVTLPQDGIYVLQLEAFDGFWTVSSRVTVARNTAISVAITAPAGSSTFTVPTNIALEASASTTSGSITQVQFYAGSLLIGTDTIAPWSYEWRNTPAGNHALYAVATSTDTNHLSLASSAVNIAVNFPTDIGRFTLASTDLAIPVAGLPITVNRSHDPRHGSGWSLGQNMRLDYEAVSITKSASLSSGYTALRSGGQDCIVPGHQTLITVSLSATEQYYFRPRIVFQAGDGSPCVGSSSVTHLSTIGFVFDAVGPLGGQLASINVPGDVGMISEGSEFGSWFGTAQPCYDEFGFGTCDESYEPGWNAFTFTAPDGTQYKFDSNGRLSQRIDRNNNSLTYSSGGITHSSGKQLTFTRDGANRITQIYDPIAIAESGVAALKYSYDGNSRLTNVARLVARASAGTYENTAYRYENSSFPNHITRVIDSRGITTVSNLFDSFGRLSRQYDGLGNYTSFAYEDNGRRQVVTDKNSKTNRQDLTEAGQLKSVQDAEGAVTTYSYDANGRRVAEITPIGATNSFGYNERDELIGATNELNFSSSATYNSFGQPLVVIDAMGFGTTNGYDAAGNLIAVTNALGVVSRYGYDSQGNRTAETNAFGLGEQAIALFQYDQFGYVTNLTDALGRITSHTYDANGNRLTERRTRTLVSGSAQTLGTTNIYDAANRVIALIEPDGFTHRTAYNAINQIGFSTNKLGVVTRFDYDARGLLTNTVFALGTALQASEQSQYDAEGRRTNSIDRASRATRYTYDGAGRLKRTTFPDGTYTDINYDPAGRIFSSDQGPQPTGMTPPPSPLPTRFQYDAAGRRTAIINALNQTNHYAHDANGNQTNFVDALGRANSYTFDRLNRQTRATFPDNTSESYGYDALNRRVAITNQAAVITRFGFDRLGQLTTVTNGFGTGVSNWATYAYDEVGNQTNQVDALNRRTRFEYDAMGRRVRIVQPGSQAELFAYDAVGNLLRHTNFNGVVITNQYDALNRLTNKSSAGAYNIATTYTATGQRKTISDPSGGYTLAYDARDRLLTNSGPAGTLLYSYDIYGRLASIGSSRSGGASVSYTYDLLNRLANVVDAVAGTTTYGYDTVGNLRTVRYPNTLTNTYSYDALNRLTNLLANGTLGTVAAFAYKLAPAGNRTNLTETVNSVGRTNAWFYDPLYRLTNETITASSGGTITYRYDAVGNRTNRTSTVSGVANQTLAYGTNDWLTTDVYDNNGNTRTNGSNIYLYDVENRLTDFNTGTATYTYNADGVRVSKTSGGTTTLYLVDDRNPTGYAQVFEELTVSGGTTNLAKVFTCGHDLIAQRIVSSGLRTFFGYDGNGNTRYLTGTNAAITDTYTHDAYGTLLASTGSTPNDYLYAGEQNDNSLGLYYLRARYLNTATGRFWSRDSFRGVRDDPATLHKYLYCANNPANCTDPTGRESLAGTATAGGIIGGFAGIQLPAISAAKAFALLKIGVVAIAIGATITGDESNNRKDRNAMRLQLQEGNNLHYWSTVMLAPANPGVTRKQVQLTLGAMFSALKLKEELDEDWDSFPMKGWETQLWSAIIRMSIRLNKFGPVSEGRRTVMQEYLDPTSEKGPRIDLENLRGTNLRQ